MQRRVRIKNGLKENPKPLLVESLVRRTRQKECFCVLHLNCVNCPTLHQKAKVNMFFWPEYLHFNVYVVTCKYEKHCSKDY